MPQSRTPIPKQSKKENHRHPRLLRWNKYIRAYSPTSVANHAAARVPGLIITSAAVHHTRYMRAHGGA